MLPKLIIYFKLFFLIIKLSKSDPVPQLNLPPINEDDKINLYPNSYTENINNRQRQWTGESNEYDRNRSFRYGPPYSDNSDEYFNNNYNKPRNITSDYQFNNLYYSQNGQQFIDNNHNNNNNNNNNDYGPPPRYNDRSPFNDQNQKPFNELDRFNDDERQRYLNDDRFNVERLRRIQETNRNLRRVLYEIDQKSSFECSVNVFAQWNFETNVNQINQLDALAAQQRYADYQRSVWQQLKAIDQNIIYDQDLYRQVRMLSIIGPSALPPDQLDRYNRIINDMLAIYNKASICAFEQPFNCGLRLQPHLKDIMAKSRDWDELQFTWTEWRRKTGRDMKDLFEQMVDLTNQAANFNNFSNGAAYWTYPFESQDFRQDAENVWSEILPLYELIHAYVRRKLREFYGPDKIQNSAPLPDHILGNMYGQNWHNILDITIPYPGKSFLDVTPEMLVQGYTPHIMYQLAEEFFLSINMSTLPQDFWIDSIIEQPIDRPILCQPSAWDFCNRKDFRIKMCTEITHKDLITVHQQMAHIHYFLSYRHQPKVFRDGANSAFHEAVGDSIALSISTPKHLQTIGLVQKSVDDTPHDINYLFALALDKVVFLPFALSLDAWRWDIFNKKINKEQYNCYWWLLREKYGGIKPPVLRSEMDFDPGAKYHVPANIPYIRFFFATILQFQLHRAMCRASLQYNPENPDKPLHKCDIYRQPAAGNLLKQIMEKGSSQPWRNVLEDVTGETRLDGSALREYFRPLEEWLRNENLRNQEFVGWSYDGDYCKHSIETANLQVYGGFYNDGNNLICSLNIYFILIFIYRLIY